MEDHIKNIEFINNYLNNELSGEALEDFETRLQNEDTFSMLYEEHLAILEGIKRNSVKIEIQKAKQRYLRTKWPKYFGFGGLVIAIIAVCILLFNSEKNTLKKQLNFEADFKQEFKVGFDSIIEVKGEKGTVIRFNPKDLETKSTDSLSIELIELTSQQDLLLANAQTVSNGEWLISGGAFKIDIKQDETSLNLKESKTIDVTFPKTTDEGDMALFYGERDVKGDMQWDLINAELKSNPSVVLFKEGFVIDTVLTTRYGGVETFKSIYVIDTLGIVSLNQIKERFPKINLFDEKVDTLKIKQEYVSIIDSKTLEEDTWSWHGSYKVNSLDSVYNRKEVVIDSVLIDLENPVLSEAREIIGELTRQIKKDELRDSTHMSKPNYIKYRDSLGYKYKVDTIQNRVFSVLYKSVQLSKLGWINIDKFAPEEFKVNVKLNYNVNTAYHQIYLVDQNNNTILNIYDDNIDLPVNRSFYLLAIAQKDDNIYGFKKSVRFNEDSNFKIDYKKINQSQIKSILTLPTFKASSIASREKQKEIQRPFPVPQDVIKKPDTTAKTKEKTLVNDIEKQRDSSVFSYLKKAQSFKIAVQSDTIITCKEGTTLKIKANTFTKSNGALVTGKIDLNIAEYYKLSDILLANLSTKSDDKLLETGGMLFVEAIQGQEQLKVNPATPIEISFSKKKDDMQLFSGNWEGNSINWKLQNQSDTRDAEPMEISRIEQDIEVPFAIIEEPPIYPGCENLDKNQTKRCMADAIQKFVRTKFDSQIASKVGLVGRQRINIIFKIDRKGKIINVHSRARNSELEEEANRVISLLPKMQPGRQRGRTVTVPYSLPIIFQVEDSGTTNLASPSFSGGTADTVSVQKVEKKLSTKSKSEVTVNEVNNYIVSKSGLGWINCDRFLSYNNNVNYKLKIDDAEGSIRLSMVFKSRNVVLPSWRKWKLFDFRSIPKNQDIILIAIKKHDNKLYYDILETRTTENPNVDFNFKEVTVEGLKKVLEVIEW
ncbi:hypothetical protein MHTCC0001_01600 [Flavobacteriaceae bacterium MHTCC 0001]